jgi:photosystem II stability/assembly factor-like uncharacterized protein
LKAYRLGGSARSLLLATSSIVLAASASGGINHWTSNGPFGASTPNLVVDPMRAGTAYATVYGYGVFRTVDGGAGWVASNQGLTGVGLVPFTMGAIAIDPVVPSTLYVGLFQGGLFKSIDSGATWQHVEFEEVGCVVVDPTTPSTVYACAGAGAGVEKSHDGGATWHDASSGMPANPNVGTVAVDPAHTGTVYALVNSLENPLYRSADGGATWASVVIPPGTSYVNGVTVDPSSRLFAATDQGVFRSTDAGATWVHVLVGGYFQLSVVVGDLYASGNVADSNAVSFPNAALRSSDGGDHWTPLDVSIVPSFFSGSAADPNTVYAGASTGVLKSSDRGVHWSPSSNGMQAVPARAAMDPANPALLYAASGGGGLFSSADGGRSWSIVSGDSRVRSLAIQPGTLDLFSEAGRSGDGGVTWQPTSLPANATVPVVAARAPQVLFAGNASCAGLSGSSGQVFKSADGGATWNVSFDSHYGACTSVVVSAPGLDVFADVDGFAFKGPFVSHDGGASWVPLDGLGYSPTFLAVDPTNRNVVYALAGGLWRSLDGGGQWQEIDAGIPPTAVPYLPFVSNLVIDPISPTTLYASTPEGVYRSLDRGGSWSPFNEGLPPAPASGLVIDATGRLLHVAAGGGVYDYQISGNCAAAGNALCLLGGRFSVTVQAIDPRTGRLEVGTALEQTDRWGYFSLPGFTGDPNFPEIVVKMADATALGEGFWVFHSGLTDLEYTLSVVDTVTGQQKSYQNDRSDPQALCGGADTGTFTDQTGSPTSGPRVAARAVAPGPALVLLDRFAATLTAIDPRTGREAGSTAIARDTKWGYFSIPDFTGDATFPEVFVKMLDATSLSGTFWVFHTGLTDLEYTLVVTDFATGNQRVYRNERSDPSRLCGGADTDAFRP